MCISDQYRCREEMAETLLQLVEGCLEQKPMGNTTDFEHPDYGTVRLFVTLFRKATTSKDATDGQGN